MQRRNLIKIAFIGLICTTLVSCSTLRAIGQLDQIGTVRSELVSYLPKFYVLDIFKDLGYLDETYAKVQKLLIRDENMSLIEVVKLAIGAPSEFNKIGIAYGNIYDTVVAYSQEPGSPPIPQSLNAFDAGVRPAYKELQIAVENNDKIRLGIELATLLKPLVVLL